MANHLFDALFAPLAGRQTGLIIKADNAMITGDGFLAMVAQLAHVLLQNAVQPGDRIAVQITKSPEALALYGATLAVGAVFLPLNTAYTADELEYFLGNATPHLFICDPARHAELAPVAQTHGARTLTLDHSAGGSLADQMRTMPAEFAPVPRGPQDLAAILYTSGTTGRSKGAMLTHDNLLSNAVVLADLWRFTDKDVLLHALPIFHTHGLFVASNIVLLARAAMIFLPGFDTATVLRLLPQATAMMGVPTFYTRLLEAPAFTRAAAAHMRLFISGSAPLLAETHLEFAVRTGHRLLERYGMTETNLNTSNPYDGDRRAGTVGFPLPGVELRISGGEAVGGIEVRGPNVFAGYWQMPDKTAEELRADGWFITGDLGMLDADGYLHIVGRAKDLIITGGYNVYPREVELLLDAVPGVLESAVIGLPHRDFGEAVFAVLTVRTGQTLDPNAVLVAVRHKLARFKQPKAAVIVADLPRNAMGKVQKNLLRQQYGGWFTP